MGGIFGMFDFTKPGKGVEKDEPKKKGVARFWELAKRKLWSYVKLNFFYLITCIPAFVVVWLILTQILQQMANAQGDALAAITFLAFVLSLFLVMCYGLSPFSAGYYYVLRNYVRENHSWVFADFYGKTKQNLKKSLIMYFIDLAFMILTLFSLRIYIILSISGMFAMQIMLIVYLIMLILYSVMTSYKWTMTVTFDLNLFQILKNSLLLVCGEFKRTLIYLVATFFYLVLFYLLFRYFFVVALILFLLIGFSLFGLIQEMNVLPVIHKYLIPDEEEEPQP